MRSQAEAILKSQVFKDLGIEIESYDPTSYLKALVSKKNISPSMLGPMGCCFSKVHVSVEAGIEEKEKEGKVVRTILHIRYEFDYHHTSGGHNGCDVRHAIDCETGLPFKNSWEK
jgi:hypothetical protein